MVKEDMLNLLNKEPYLFATDIIARLRKNDEAKEGIRISLKQLRKYREVKFVLVTFENQKNMAKRFHRVKEYLDKGNKIRGPKYLYFMD